MMDPFHGKLLSEKEMDDAIKVTTANQDAEEDTSEASAAAHDLHVAFCAFDLCALPGLLKKRRVLLWCRVTSCLTHEYTVIVRGSKQLLPALVLYQGWFPLRTQQSCSPKLPIRGTEWRER